jgi:hypothetical protein
MISTRRPSASRTIRVISLTLCARETQINKRNLACVKYVWLALSVEPPLQTFRHAPRCFVPSDHVLRLRAKIWDGPSLKCRIQVTANVLKREGCKEFYSEILSKEQPLFASQH